MIRNLPTRLFMALLCALGLLMVYLLSPSDKLITGIHETKINLVNHSKQKTVKEFQSQRKDYAYVSFDNLYSNTSLYYGTKVYQNGHITDLDMEHKYLLVALDGNDTSRTVKLRYNQASFAREDVELRQNDPIKFYGRVLATDSYVNEKGRDINRPVISADFIQLKNKTQGENYGVI